MKIVLPQETDGFRLYEHTFCGIPSFLVIPGIDPTWTKQNLYFRSLVINKQTLEVLSAGWPKFFNFGEKPTCYPDPNSYNDWKIEEKIDGSLVICDYINGVFNMRTRGTVSHTVQENSKDFELLTKNHPKVATFLQANPNLSLLFEIVTPNNVIVIRPSETYFVFLGAVNKNSLTIVTEKETTEIAKEIDISLPKKYKFNSLIEACEAIKQWKGKEGIVLSYNNNQNRIKIKSDWYLWLHRIKSQLNSEDNLIELFVNEGMPEYEVFYNLLVKTFDWEIAEQLKSQISKLADAGKNTKKIVMHMKDFVATIKGYSTRKEQARAIISSYGGPNNNRASMLFTLLDGKELSKEQLTKLIYQVI